MFPQSELDNYKLQVELLQEKLQRSEISRQQLEHKLDKILQRRDEHDKIVRSKSKQKYQQFLEEQQRRNERNKQLVQMLERIEQQTATMNARSERLKMMKLQYEMYFAKLVHSQTRRCIQSSAMSMMTPMMGTTAAMAGGTLMQSGMMPTAEGYNYSKAYHHQDPTVIANNYQGYTGADPINTNRENYFNRIQKDFMPDPKLMEMPMSEYNINSAKSDGGMDIRKDPPRPYHMQAAFEINLRSRNSEEHPEFEDPTARQISRQHKSYTNAPESRGYEPMPSAASLLDKSKQYTDLDLPTTISSNSGPLTFDRLPSVNMTIGNTLRETFENTSSLSTAGNSCVRAEPQQDKANILVNQQADVEKKESIITPLEEATDLTTFQTKQDYKKDNPSNQEKPKHTEKEAVSQVKQQVPMDISTKQEEKFESKIESPKHKPLDEKETLSTNAITSISLGENTPAPPVSIENIESAIYGELVNSPEETQLQQPDKPTVLPALLENLVTQSPTNLETEAASIDQKNEEEQEYKAEADTANTTTLKENMENTLSNENYLETYEYNNPTPVDNVDATNTAEYEGYENNANTTGATQEQEQQQYDYSNYDPSQYSYPGYIYDETTGEYKPDPNATAEQYATDQQYNEGYEQQYQQQEGYDYNQSYDQQDMPANNVDPAAVYENYDAAQGQEELATTNEIPQEETALQQQTEDPAITETEATSSSQLSAELVGKTPNKPTSILATADKKDTQKNKKRVNFVDSSETDESSVDKTGKGQAVAMKPNAGNESDFDFSSSSEVGGATK